MLEKLTLLQNYCVEYGMQVNQSKTSFCCMWWCKRLRGADGTWFEGGVLWLLCISWVHIHRDGSVSCSVKAHASAKWIKTVMCHFFLKKQIFDAALLSSLRYRCESWVGADLRPMNKLYNWCLRKLLWVTKSTCNDVCYVESVYLSLQDLVKNKYEFFQAMWQERSGYRDDPLAFVINLV